MKMKNQDFKAFFQRASADPMQIDEEEAKRVLNEVRTARAKPLNRLFSSRMWALFLFAFVMFGLLAPFVILAMMVGTFVIHPYQLDVSDLSIMLGVVAWLAIVSAVFRLQQRIDKAIYEIGKTEMMLCLVEKNDRLVREAIDICSVVPKAQEMLSSIHQAHRSFRVMHLNAMRRLDTQNLVAQKIVERQQKSKAQDAQRILAERQTLQNLAT